MIVARPATEPVITSTKLILPRKILAMINQAIIPLAKPTKVFVKALVAKAPADKAPPELKPNQPNHKSPVPIAAAIKLFGCIPCLATLRLPKTKILAKAAKPAVVWITVPPAKSTKPHLDRKPSPQTQ